MSAPHRPLTSADLLSQGPLRRLGRRVFLHDTLDSTNRFLLDHAADAGDGAVACAESQSAGRGRLGRRWEAPRGSSVLLSVLLHEPADTPLLSQGALLASVAACEAVAAATDCSPVVRWPNDVVLNGRKLGGVLAESCALRTAEGAARRAVVIGIGLNCLQQRGHFAGEFADRATSLECESRHAVDRALVAGHLLARLDTWLAMCNVVEGGWQRMRTTWRKHCEDIGTRVTLEHDGRTFAGTALDLDDQGDLIVQLDHGGRRHFAATTTTRAG
ncbi:MAG TPA: biotin--[acetyl-CoA-carboxylase] ligase [Phycisphaerae bacterium]|nr:biotin--[acetyl-CoA-carboxylase] ligase [Phycisphaerae bacterium]HPM23287.1 biotin--[acetyl-CoA-carboxylase] ligase [Phycisphaerae bacterium]